MRLSEARTDSAQQAFKPTPLTRADLMDTRELRDLFGEAFIRISQRPSFPRPAVYLNGKRMWGRDEVVQWDRTHCTYGTGATRCTRPRAKHSEIALCEEHLMRARKTLKRKDPK